MIDYSFDFPQFFLWLSFGFLIVEFSFWKLDVAEEEGIVFMLEETCNRAKMALAEVKANAHVIIWLLIEYISLR